MKPQRNNRQKRALPSGKLLTENQGVVSISRIESQKKSKDRYSLFTDSDFLIGLSAESLLKSGIKKGDKLSSDQLKSLIELEEKNQIRTYLFRLLSRRDHSRFELKNKAQIVYGFNEPQSVWIDEIIANLCEKGYINEESYARKYIIDKSTLSGWGPTKIRSALLQKKIPASLIDSLIPELITEDHKLSTAQTLLLKKKWYFDKFSDQVAKKLKMQAFLVQRGFSYSVIDQAITINFQTLDVSKPDT